MCAWSRLASSAMNGRRRIFLTMIDSWDDFHPAPIHPRPQATWSDFPTHGRGHPMLGGREGKGKEDRLATPGVLAGPSQLGRCGSLRRMSRPSKALGTKFQRPHKMEGWHPFYIHPANHGSSGFVSSVLDGRLIFWEGASAGLVGSRLEPPGVASLRV